MLRIQSGLYKGRKLKSINDSSVRPTTSRLKISMFDILQSQIKETIVLDGFAGNGNIGIEALSRGADYVVFIDTLPEAIQALQHNLDKIEIPSDNYRIINGDFNRSVITLGKNKFKFDFIFLDPPYELLEYANPLKVIFKRNILKETGTIVLERPSYIKFTSKYFECFRSHQLGKRYLDFYHYSAAELENLSNSENI
jgi:16S rRNA (guanine(966)-N(2))-methyltransferase RsmD